MSDATGCPSSYHVAAGQDGLLMASGEFDGDFGEEALDFISALRGKEESIRSLSRRSGVPYSTLQGIISGKTQNASQLTMGRLEAAAYQSPVFTVERAKTFVSDSIAWNGSKLANIEPPPGTVAFQLVGHAPRGQGGMAFTQRIDLGTKVPADYLTEPGFNARAVTRIVWFKGRNG